VIFTGSLTLPLIVILGAPPETMVAQEERDIETTVAMITEWDKIVFFIINKN
jgi:hypothetical protein